MGALKVMAVVIGGVLLVLAAIALVAALLLGYAIGSLGLAKVVLLILAVVLALAGVIFIIVGMRGRQAEKSVEETVKGQRFDVGGIQLEVMRPPLEPTPDFPDLEFEVRATGFSHTDVNPETGQVFGEPVVFFKGLRITNHEKVERVNLTFHAHVPVKPEFQEGLEAVALRPATRMPISVEPRSSEMVTLYFRRGYFPPDEHLSGPTFLDVEDHLSGKATSIPTHKRWRPAKEGKWTGAFLHPQPERELVQFLREKERESQSLAAWIAGGLSGGDYKDARRLVDSWSEPIAMRLLAYDPQLVEMFNDDGGERYSSLQPGEALNRRLEQLRKAIAEVERRQ